MIRPPPRSPLFPYPTLSRSLLLEQLGEPLGHLERRDLEDLRRLAERRLLPRDGLERSAPRHGLDAPDAGGDRKSTRLNSSHSQISYAVFCLKKKKITI